MSPSTAPRRLTRRQVIGAAGGTVAALGAAGVGVERGLLPGRQRVGSLLGADGDPVPMPTDPAGGVVEGAPFASRWRPGTPEPWAWSTPPGLSPTGLPVVVVLHGWGDDHRFCFDRLGMHRFQARVVAEGHQPFVLASLDGERNFWHPHHSGPDWARLVAEGLLGELGRLGADTTRLGFVGWSMGGYGALRLAADELHGRVRAVGTMSTALYQRLADCPHEGAFDDEADFRANRLVDRLDRLRGLPVHVACGVNDRYLRINQWLAGQLDPGTQVMWRRGNHTPDLWRLAAPVQLRFVADHL